MKLLMQNQTRPDGTVSSGWSFEGEVIDLAAAADILLGAVNEDMLCQIAAFAAETSDALIGDEPE